MKKVHQVGGEAGPNAAEESGERITVFGNLVVIAALDKSSFSVVVGQG